MYIIKIIVIFIITIYSIVILYKTICDILQLLPWIILMMILLTAGNFFKEKIELDIAIITDKSKLTIDYFKNSSNWKEQEIYKTMYFETARTLDPLQPAKNSNAFGLFQWLPDRGKTYKTIGKGIYKQRFYMKDLRNGGTYKGVDYTNLEYQLIAGQIWYHQYKYYIEKYGEGGMWLSIFQPALLIYAANRDGPDTKMSGYKKHIGVKTFNRFALRNAILKKAIVVNDMTNRVINH